MNNIINAVTPHTSGLIWFPKDEIRPGTTSYLGIDYLLDGLLTAGLKSSHDFTSQVIMGQNYSHPIYVFIAKKLISKELDSFLVLVKGELKSESDILIIDEREAFAELKQMTPKDLQSRYHLIS